MGERGVFMNCGNCGKGNEYGAKICVHCGSTLALTEYYRRKGFVEKKDTPKKPKEEPWDQEILTTGYHSKHRRPQEEQESTVGSHSWERSASGEKGIRQGRSASGGKNTQQRKSSSGGTTSTRRGDNASRTSSAGTRQEGKGGKTSAKKSSSVARSTAASSDREGTKRAESSSGKKKTSTGAKKPTQVGKGNPKKIPKSKVYNHTTKSLSLAERMVKKKTEKDGNKNRKWILSLAVVLVILIVAAGIFIGSMHFSSEEDRYTEGAEAFVRAMVMDDEETLGEHVHTKMYGSLHPLGYQNVDRCDTKIVEYQEVDPLQIEQELQSRYGITDSVRKLYRVHVGCTIYAEETYACAMDVFMAEIDGEIYAVKTENISDPVGT